MDTPSKISQADHDPKHKPTEPATKPSTEPSEKTGYRPDEGEGGSYEKEGTRPPRGNEMPQIDESTAEGEARNERIKIVHDPKSDDKDLDAFSKRVNDPDTDEGQAPQHTPQKF